MNRQELAYTLAQHGVRPTQQRLAVFDYLLEHRTHPSAESVYTALVERYPTFSRTTVYNSLHALVQAGLAIELSLGTEEKHYDADISIHGHFHCRECGRIADVPLNAAAVEQLQPGGYTVEICGFSFSGLCPQCGKVLQ